MSNDTVYTAPPAPATPPTASPLPVQPPKIRRVGTFTMGLSLMATGGAAIYSLFNPSVNLLTIFRFTPAILIILGIEILVFAIIGGSRLKYDFLSMVVCTLLIGTTLCLSAVPFAYTHWGPERSYTENRLEGELYDLCYQQLGNNSNVSTVSVSVDLRTRMADESLTVSSLTPGDWVRCTIELDGDYPSARAFAESCKTVMSKLLKTGAKFDSVMFTSNGNVYYELELNGLYRQSMTADKLEPFVTASPQTDETVTDEEPVEQAEESEGLPASSEPETPDQPSTPSVL